MISVTKKKETTTKDTVHMESTKKRMTKKTAVKDAAIYVEFAGKQINVNDVLEAARTHYTANFEKENGAAKYIALYIKPEENTAYYVINGTGSSDYKVELSISDAK